MFLLLDLEKTVGGALYARLLDSLLHVQRFIWVGISGEDAFLVAVPAHFWLGCDIL